MAAYQRAYLPFGLTCVSADAAADFSAALDLGSRSTADAADAAFFPVVSFRAISITYLSSYPHSSTALP